MLVVVMLQPAASPGEFAGSFGWEIDRRIARMAREAAPVSADDQATQSGDPEASLVLA
jgi:hypothetical protein